LVSGKKKKKANLDNHGRVRGQACHHVHVLDERALQSEHANLDVLRCHVGRHSSSSIKAL